MAMEKILVTGGNGFIGSHVVDLLLDKGYQVVVFERHREHDQRADAELYLGDLKDYEAVRDAVAKSDGAINLAGILGTAETVSAPHESVRVNVLGALNVFEAVRKLERPCVHITVGNYTWLNTYAISKYASERFALMYNQEHGTKIAVVRGLNVYGPRQKAAPVKKVVPNFIISALRNDPITIYGDGKQQIDLIYVEDVAEILVRALVLDHNCYDRVMEAGSGEMVTVNRLAELIIDTCDSESKLQHQPMRPGEPSRSVQKADLSTLEPLQYEPVTSLEEGMSKTVRWYRNNVNF